MDTQTLIRLIIGVADDRRRAGLRRQARAVADQPDPVGPEDHRRERPQGRPQDPHHHPVHRGLRANAAAEAGRSPASPTSSPCGASSSSRTVYLEAYGVLFNPKFAIPFVGHWDALGFLQDFFARRRAARHHHVRDHPAALRAQGVRPRLALLRLAHRRRLADPVHDLQRHLDLRALPRRRRGQRATCPTAGARSSRTAWVRCCRRSASTANEIIETVALLLHIGVMLVFLLIVLHSKHLHIGLAPINVTFKRLPNALGPLLPMEYKGEPIDFEDPAEDAVLGRGKIEDFTWKGYLDFTTCTECGRCQSQCPAWNTGKPLSPKLVIMNLRDHLFAKAPYILGDKEIPAARTPPRSWRRPRAAFIETKHDEEHARPGVRLRARPRLRPRAGHPPARRHRSKQGGVIDPDVLWSCTTCGACVEQCPVDIEHIDHIVDMRRYQVMMESEFPGELGVLFKNLETQGQPLGPERQGPHQLDRRGRLRRAGLRQGRRLASTASSTCSGSAAQAPIEDRAKKTTKAVAELLAIAGREVPGARRGRDLHRRLGTTRRQRVPVPAAGRAERRDPQRAVRGRRDGRPQDRRHLPALLQHAGPRVPAGGRQLHGAAPHAAAEPAGPRQEAGAGQPGRARTSPTTTRATWAGTTRSTRRRAS